MNKKIIRSIIKISNEIIFGDIRNNFSKKNPLLILTPEKTGSTSVYTSLRNIKNKSIFKLHFISKIGFEKYKLFINRKYKSFIDKNITSKIRPHIVLSSLLMKKLNRYQDNIQIIVTIRNPIDQRISSIFQSWESNNITLFNKVESDAYNKTLKLIINNIKVDNPSYYIENWLKNEIEIPFKINVFSKPFSEEKGYEIYNQGNISLLLMKMETINNVFKEAISEFLNTDEKIPINIKNIGDEKLYQESYKLIRKNLKIEEETINEIMNTKYFEHFYIQQTDEIFHKWSKPNKIS